MKTIFKPFLFNGSLVVLIIAAAFIQARFDIFSHDVAWLLHCTQTWLSGGHYYTDFFETNPPFILYLNIPPVLIAKYFYLSLQNAMVIYIVLLALFSLWVCNHLWRIHFSSKARFLFSLAYIFIWTILPTAEFGQRENLAMILIAPYLSLIALRAEQIRPQTFWIWAAGILGTAGFLIKPHFLVIPFLLESYLLFEHRRDYFKKFWRRPEMVILFVACVAYAASLFLITPEYIQKILPLDYRLYLAGMWVPWRDLLSQPIIFITFIMLGIFLIFRDQLRYRFLGDCISLAIIGFIIAYLAQRLTWFYHLLPFYGLSIFLPLLVAVDALTHPASKNRWREAKTYYLIIGLFITGLLVAGILGQQISLIQKYKKHSLTSQINRVIDRKPGGVFPFTMLFYNIAEFHQPLASRMPNQPLLPGIVNLSKQNLSKAKRQQLNRDIKTLTQMTIEDFKKNRPVWVLVEKRSQLSPSQTLHINYIGIFSRDPKFRSIWAQYHYVTTIDRIEIWQRNY